MSGNFGKKNYDNNSTLDVNTIFKSVEENNLMFLAEHLTCSNVNMTDNFGWTPLMCAVFCENVSLVKFLLKLGADKLCIDKSGISALNIATKKNNASIIKLLNIAINEKYKGKVKNRKVKPENIVDDYFEFYCSICKITIKNETIKSHNTSIIHIFNEKSDLPDSITYGISKNNKGYQMLLNSGWCENNGLGPSGSGLKHPIKTILKCDRKGLGFDKCKYKAKVTHYPGGHLNDVKSVNNDSTIIKCTSFRKRAQEKMLTEKRREIALRKALE